MTLTTRGSAPVANGHSANLTWHTAPSERCCTASSSASPLPPRCASAYGSACALAVRQSANMAGPIAMAVGIGVLNGVFFGTWAGFVASNDTFDELDHLADSVVDRES